MALKGSGLSPQWYFITASGIQLYLSPKCTEGDRVWLKKKKKKEFKLDSIQILAQKIAPANWLHGAELTCDLPSLPAILISPSRLWCLVCSGRSPGSALWWLHEELLSALSKSTHSFSATQGVHILCVAENVVVKSKSDLKLSVPCPVSYTHLTLPTKLSV